MDLRRALGHLAEIGITEQVLRDSDVDPTDPAAVRGEVELTLTAALTAAALTDMRGLVKLQLALGALTPDNERGDAVAGLIYRNLLVTGRQPAATVLACVNVC